MHRQDVGWGRGGLCHGLAAAGSAWIGDGDHNQARLTRIQLLAKPPLRS